MSRNVKLSVKPTVWIIRVGRGGKNPPRLDYTSRETFHLFRQTGLRPRENNTEDFHTLFPACGVRFTPRNNIYSHSFSFVFFCFLHCLRGQSDVSALWIKAFIDTGCMLKIKTYFIVKGMYVLCLINSSTCIFVYAIIHSTLKQAVPDRRCDEWWYVTAESHRLICFPARFMGTLPRNTWGPPCNKCKLLCVDSYSLYLYSKWLKWSTLLECYWNNE